MLHRCRCTDTLDGVLNFSWIIGDTVVVSTTRPILKLVTSFPLTPLNVDEGLLVFQTLCR